MPRERRRPRANLAVRQNPYHLRNRIRTPQNDIDELSSDDYTLSAEDLTDNDNDDEGLEYNSDSGSYQEDSEAEDVEMDEVDNEDEDNVEEQEDDDDSDNGDPDPEDDHRLPGMGYWPSSDEEDDDEVNDEEQRGRIGMNFFRSVVEEIRNIFAGGRNDNEDEPLEYTPAGSEDDDSDELFDSDVSEYEVRRESSPERDVQGQVDEIVLDSDGEPADPANDVLLEQQEARYRFLRSLNNDNEQNDPPAKRARVEEVEEASNDAHEKVEDNDEGCPICYEEFSSNGQHRLVSLACGHYFGHSCIDRWLRNDKRVASCPNCKQKASTKDIRFHFARILSAVDNGDIEKLKLANAELVKKVAQLERQNTDLAITCTQKEDQIMELMRVKTRGGRIGASFEMRLQFRRSWPIRSGPADEDPTLHSRVFDYSPTAKVFCFAHAEDSVFGKFGIKFCTPNMKKLSYAPLFTKPVRAIAYSPHAPEMVVCGGEDKTVKLYDTLNSTTRKTWTVRGSVMSLSWVNAHFIVVGSAATITFIDIRQSTPVREARKLGKTSVHFIAHDEEMDVTFAATFDRLAAYIHDIPIDLLRGSEVKAIRSAAYDPKSRSLLIKAQLMNNQTVHQLLMLKYENDKVVVDKTKTWPLGLGTGEVFGTDCLFTLGQTTYTIVHDKNAGNLVVHDWSKQMSDKACSLPEETRHTNFYAIKIVEDESAGGDFDVYCLNGQRVVHSTFKIVMKRS